jgi:hypothetical protein
MFFDTIVGKLHDIGGSHMTGSPEPRPFVLEVNFESGVCSTADTAGSYPTVLPCACMNLSHLFRSVNSCEHSTFVGDAKDT